MINPDMINPEEFSRVCRLAKLVEVSNSKTHVFKTFDQSEGIELVAGKIQTFQIIKMKDHTKEKAISEKATSKEIIAVIGAFEKDVRSDHNSKDNQNIQQSIEKNIPANPIGIMPDTLTDKLFEKWQALPVPQRLIRLQQTSPQHIRTRKGRGGSSKYVDISYMLKCANMAFGFVWDSKVTGWKETTTEIICFGTVEANLDGKRIIKSACGQRDISFTEGTTTIMCLGDDYKAAQSDMIKKALSQFGIANDVYGGEV